MAVMDLPRLPSVSDYWGVAAGQSRVPAVIMPDREDTPTLLPAFRSEEIKGGYKAFVVLTLAIMLAIVLAYWLESKV